MPEEGEGNPPGHPPLQTAERGLFTCLKPCSPGCRAGLTALSALLRSQGMPQWLLPSARGSPYLPMHHRPGLSILLRRHERFPSVLAAPPWDDTCLFAAISEQCRPATPQPQRSARLLQHHQLGIPLLTNADLAACPAARHTAAHHLGSARGACPSRGTAAWPTAGHPSPQGRDSPSIR